MQDSPEGVTAAAITRAVGASHPTVASALNRHFWAGRIDRYDVRGAFIYTPRPRP